MKTKMIKQYIFNTIFGHRIVLLPGASLTFGKSSLAVDWTIVIATMFDSLIHLLMAVRRCPLNKVTGTTGQRVQNISAWTQSDIQTSYKESYALKYLYTTKWVIILVRKWITGYFQNSNKVWCPGFIVC